MAAARRRRIVGAVELSVGGIIGSGSNYCSQFNECRLPAYACQITH
jgi:hypothetical protein